MSDRPAPHLAGKGHEMFFVSGRALLLAKIAEHGSLRKAAKTWNVLPGRLGKIRKRKRSWE